MFEVNTLCYAISPHDIRIVTMPESCSSDARQAKKPGRSWNSPHTYIRLSSYHIDRGKHVCDWIGKFASFISDSFSKAGSWVLLTIVSVSCMFAPWETARTTAYRYITMPHCEKHAWVKLNPTGNHLACSKIVLGQYLWRFWGKTRFCDTSILWHKPPQPSVSQYRG